MERRRWVELKESKGCSTQRLGTRGSLTISGLQGTEEEAITSARAVAMGEKPLDELS